MPLVASHHLLRTWIWLQKSHGNLKTGASAKHQFVVVFTCLSRLSPIREASPSQHDLQRRQGGILELSLSQSRLRQRRMLSSSSPSNSMSLGKSELMHPCNICWGFHPQSVFKVSYQEISLRFCDTRVLHITRQIKADTPHSNSLLMSMGEAAKAHGQWEYPIMH